jgi:hypothetical protein
VFHKTETSSQELSNTKQHTAISLEIFVGYDDIEYVDNES